MNPDLYRAAMNGNTDLQEYSSQLETQLTPNRNTALHIAAMFGKSLCAIEILRSQPSLLLSRNNKGETPFHIAACEGHIETVRSLIEFAKTELSDWVNDLMRLTNDDGDTALHDAVRFQKFDVVKLLVREDREFLHPCNKAEETPLYLAAEKGLPDFVSVILRYCKSATYIGPMRRTALHAAVIHGFKGCIEKLLKWKPIMLKETDIEGRTPIHFAAFLSRSVWVLEKLLDTDASIAYLAEDNELKRTPIHIAASKGRIHKLEMLISRFPDCWESVDGRGQNILHIAIGNSRLLIMRYILQNPMMSRLVNQKDFNGNTPLHLNSTKLTYPPIFELARDPRVDKTAFNNENLTPLDLAIREVAPGNDIAKTVKQLEKNGVVLGLRDKTSFEINSNMSKFFVMPLSRSREIVDTHMVVGALIVTIAFTAGFTIPGGYNGNEGPDQGTAILSRKTAFTAFMISDAIALLLAAIALAKHFAASFSSAPTQVHYLMESGANLIIVALGAMMVAFATGTYVVLERQSRTLATVVCTLSCSFIVYFFLLPNVFHNFFEKMYIAFLRLDSLTD